MYQSDQSAAYAYIVRFQKKSIPTPRIVIGNSEGDGGLNNTDFEKKYEAKLEIPGSGRVQTKEPSSGEVYTFFLETHPVEPSLCCKKNLTH